MSITKYVSFFSIFLLMFSTENRNDSERIKFKQKVIYIIIYIYIYVPYSNSIQRSWFPLGFRTKFCFIKCWYVFICLPIFSNQWCQCLPTCLYKLIMEKNPMSAASMSHWSFVLILSWFFCSYTNYINLLKKTNSEGRDNIKAQITPKYLRHAREVSCFLRQCLHRIL